MQEQNWIMGLWKFRDAIPSEKLAEIANKWAAEDPRYLQLYIRKVSKDQRGIGFTYEIPKGQDPMSAQEDYFESTSDYLRRCFGNDLAGWDLATTVYVIK